MFQTPLGLTSDLWTLSERVKTLPNHHYRYKSFRVPGWAYENMTDFLSPDERSERMSRIRSHDTKPELALRLLLHGMGLRYRLGGAGLPGRPDLVFPRHGAIIFVHGCFWHRHPGCKVATTPKSNTAFWEEKFRRNVERDARVVATLRRLGWRVKIVWECDLSTRSRALETARHVRTWLLRERRDKATHEGEDRGQLRQSKLSNAPNESSRMISRASDSRDAMLAAFRD